MISEDFIDGMRHAANEVCAYCKRKIPLIGHERYGYVHSKDGKTMYKLCNALQIRYTIRSLTGAKNL